MDREQKGVGVRTGVSNSYTYRQGDSSASVDVELSDLITSTGVPIELDIRRGSNHISIKCPSGELGRVLKFLSESGVLREPIDAAIIPIGMLAVLLLILIGAGISALNPPAPVVKENVQEQSR